MFLCKQCQCSIPKRFVLVGMVFIGYIYTYYLHTNVGMAVVSMTAPKHGSNNSRPEFEWNSKERGIVLGSLNYGRLFGLPGGIFAGRVGGSTGYSISIILAATISFLTPFLLNINFYLYILANASIGMLESLSFSCISQLWSRWAPPNERSKMISFSVIGIFLGSMVSFVLSGYILKTYSWSILYYGSGVIGLIWFWIWFLVVSDDPVKDKCISDAERKYIIEQVNSAPTKKLFYPWSKIYTCLPFWIGCLAKFSMGCGGFFVVSYFPQYLKDTSDLEIDKIGYFSTIPMVFALASMMLFGVLFDHIRKINLMSVTNLHRTVGAVGLFIGGLVFLLIRFWPSLIGGLVCISVYQFVTSATIIDMQILVFDLAPRYAAFLNANTNFFFTWASILTPTFVGFVVTEHSLSQWNICFMTFTAIYFSTALCCLGYISGDLQPWANYKSDGIEKNSKEISESQ